MASHAVSVVIPARNEASSIGSVVSAVRSQLPDAEVIVVDDGSTDATGSLAREAGARVIRHPLSRGNGAAVKSGARAAARHTLVFMDGDGQHDPSQVRRLLDALELGHDMAVGARRRADHASWPRWLGNSIYNRLASWLVGQPVADLTSGFRAARADRFREFLSLLPNGFSYPTTSTMAFFRAGYSVAFVPVEVARRADGSKSHIRLLRDGSRFLLIIFRVATLYSPLKVFVPLSALFFLSGCGYLTYTLLDTGRFTLFSGLLFITSILIFLIGLVSEQITSLLYAREVMPGEGVRP